MAGGKGSVMNLEKLDGTAHFIFFEEDLGLLCEAIGCAIMAEAFLVQERQADVLLLNAMEAAFKAALVACDLRNNCTCAKKQTGV